MISKPIQEITKDDIKWLIREGIPEGRRLDYKRELYGSSEKDKFEWLKDATSFLNADGGDLIFGIEQTSDGKPKRIVGIPELNSDEEIARLQNILRSGVLPRPPEIQAKVIDDVADHPVLIVRISKSWNSPHMLGMPYRKPVFYRRHSNQNLDLDVEEIRAAFLASGELGERVRTLRLSRLQKIQWGETPVPLIQDESGFLVLHVLPMSCVSVPAQYDVQLLCNDAIRRVPFPLSRQGFSDRYNLDGIVSYSTSAASDRSHSYTQVFRSGIIEGVEKGIVREHEGNRGIPSTAIEERVMQSTKNYIDVLKFLGATPPYVVLLSLLGVRKTKLFVAHDIWDDAGDLIDRDELLLNDTVLDGSEQDFAVALKPLFDVLWQAAGYERSLNYDADGKWRRK